jgi:hypothetical protein
MMYVIKSHKPFETFHKILIPHLLCLKADANGEAIISMTVQSDTRNALE